VNGTEPPVAVPCGAEHIAVVPPFVPVQLHVYGPVPVTVVAVPALHKPEVGADAVATPLALPHCPFTGVVACGAEHIAVVPPFVPVQLHE
jgi:hypothetical protein